MGLNNIAEDVWGFSKKVAKNISGSANTYLKQTPEELANVAKNTMLKKNTLLSNINISDVDSAFAEAAKRGESDYSKAFIKFKSNIDAGNVDEVKHAAKDISERFNDSRYLDLLQKAEIKQTRIQDRISGFDVEEAQRVYKDSVKVPKIIDNFVTDSQAEKFSNGIYSLQGKKQYFDSGNKKTNQIRAGAAVGGYFGAMTTARIAHGGTPITNEYGERDIVGIPFI